jgi:hypothetical protein
MMAKKGVGGNLEFIELGETAGADTDGYSARFYKTATDGLEQDLVVALDGDTKRTFRAISNGWYVPVFFLIYKDGTVTDNAMAVLGHLAPRSVTIAAPSMTVSVGDPRLKPMTIDDCVITGYSSDGKGFAQSPQLPTGMQDSVGQYFDFKCYNNAGQEVNFSSSTPPGIYTTELVPKAGIDSNWKYYFSIIPGTITVTGPTYSLTGQAMPFEGETAGDMALIAPDVITIPTGSDTWSTRYAAGEDLEFMAAPATGYAVDFWMVGTQQISASSMENPNMLTIKMQPNDLSVQVHFTRKFLNGSFGVLGGGGSVHAVANGAAALPASFSAQEGTEIKFNAAANPGWEFEDWCVQEGNGEFVYIRGNSTLQLVMPGENLQVWALFEETDSADIAITSADITVTAPTTGAVPDAAAGGTGDFTIGAVSWMPDDSLFKGNTHYTAQVTLTVKANYTFTGLTTATINGQTATITANTGGTVTLSHQFAATSAATVEDIQIASQPGTLTYTSGDALALTGLSVKLLYNDGTDETVPLADFASRNISTDPAEGTVLTVAHDGTTISVSFDGYSANTDALVVNLPDDATVAAPTMAGKTENSVTLSAVASPGNGQAVEYAVSTTDTAPADGWQDALTFDGLDEYTEYYFFARAKADSTHSAGTASVGTAIRTSDATAPTGVITVKTTEFDSFLVTDTIGLFFKDTVGVTVTGDDSGSGVDKVEYHLSTTVLPDTTDWSAINWTIGSSIDVAADWTGIVYAKITDVEGNARVIRTDGMVVYTDSLQDTALISYVTGTAADQTATVRLNGNSIKDISNGSDTLVYGTDYTVDNNAITFKASYLEGLAVGGYTLTVSYNPQGAEYVDAPDNEEPATTAIALTVNLAPPVTYTLSIDGGTGSGVYEAGTTVTIIADVPPTGKVFDRWIATGGGSFADANSATTTFTMPAGAVTVTATYKDAPVVPIPVTAITISGGGSISTKGGTLLLTANIVPANAANKAVTWAIVSGSIYATVDANGLFTARGDGTVVVRATAKDGSGVYGDVTVTITGQSGGSDNNGNNGDDSNNDNGGSGNNGNGNGGTGGRGSSGGSGGSGGGATSTTNVTIPAATASTPPATSTDATVPANSAITPNANSSSTEDSAPAGSNIANPDTLLVGADAQEAQTDFPWWILVILGALIIAGIAILLIRRRTGKVGKGLSGQ